MTASGYLDHDWHAVPDDLVGGWCVMPLDEPPSLGVQPAANFATRELAEHIARLHNAWRRQD